MIDGSLTLILPAHDEADNLPQVVRQANDTIPGFVRAHEIIIVDDGSRDGTPEIADALAADLDHVRVVHHPVNRGYGAALRSGLGASTGDWVMVMDSDRQFDIADLVYMAPFVEAYDLVAGYRMNRRDPAHRILFGKTFRLAMRTLFGVQLYDIDCAFKIMRGDLVRRLPLKSSGALISTELMARWARAGGSWAQVGVNHYPRTAGQQSGGSLKVILRAMRDVPVLWFRLNRETPVERVDGAEPQPTGLSLTGAAVAGALLLATTISLVIRLFRQR